ncbi:hypothetical protein BsWGS_24324 [Bradybaena similaris]
MNVHMFLNGAVLLLMFLTSGVSAALERDTGRTAEEKVCDELRRELTALYRLIYEKKGWPTNLKKLLPLWIESYMPVNCIKPRSFRRHSSRPSSDAKGVFAMSSKMRHTREVINDNFQYEVPRFRRSILPATDDQMIAILRDKRSTNVNDAVGETDNSDILYRQKRFLAPGSSVPAPDFSAMTLGTLNPTPGREISESAQMMNSLLMLTKLQKSRVSQEYRNIGRNSYIGDRVSFGSGMYGDSYPVRRKREISNNIANYDTGVRPDVLAGSNLRRKRFLFNVEPTEVLKTPSLFSIHQGTALDPNTGKRLEFGGEAMNRAFGSTLMSFLPPGFQPPPGTEPGDFIKTVSPLLLANNGGVANIKTRHRNGLFGDALPGKRKRKRSPDDSSKDVVRLGDIPVDLFGRKGEAKSSETSPILLPSVYPINHKPIPPHKLIKSLALNRHNNNKLWNLATAYYNLFPSFFPLPPQLLLGRKRRSTNSDVVTIGDVTIPVDFFKPQDRQSYEDSRSEQDSSSPPAPPLQQRGKNASQNTRHIHQAYQSIIASYKQALHDSQHNNLNLYKILQRPVAQQSPQIVYQNPPAAVPHPQRYPTYLPTTSHSRPLLYVPNSATIQHPAPLTQTSPLLFQPQSQPPFISSPLNPPPSYLLNPPPPLPLVPPPPPPPFIPFPPPPPYIPPPQPPSIQPQPLSKSINLLSPIHNAPPQEYLIPPPQNHYPPPPVNAFLPPTQQHRGQRIKRSNDPSDKSSNSYNFSPSIFPFNAPSIFAPTSYIPQVYSSQSNKIGHRDSSGGIIYGDRPLWQHQPSSSLMPASVVPTSRYPATNTNKHSSLPGSGFSQLPASPARSGIPQFPPIVYSPTNALPLGFNTPRGVLYGDRIPGSGADTSPQSPSIQPQLLSKSFNSLPPIHNVAPQEYLIPPPPNHYPSPPVNAFLPPTQQHRGQRIKRSNDASDKSSNNYNFSPSIFPFNTPSIFAPTPYIPQVYSSQSNKIGHRDPSGGIIYGDRPLWQHQSSSSLVPTSVVPTSRYPATNTNRHSSLLGSGFSPLPASPTRSVLPQFSPIIHSPTNALPLGFNTPGGVLYGDRIPGSGAGIPAHISGLHQPPQAYTRTQGSLFG